MKVINLLAALFTACLPLQVSGVSVPGDAYDHIKNKYIPEGIRWLEVGFFLVIQNQWTPIVTTYTNFSDPVVFLSLPNLAGETSSLGSSMSLRVRNTNLNYVDHDTKLFSFEAKSLSVNDSFCTERKTFYTPSEFVLPASFIGWLVVERGMFNISHKAFIINTDVINRTNANDSTDPRNRFKSFAQNGMCDFGKNCNLKNVATILTIAQLQTTRYDRFLLLRSIGTGKRFVVYVLTPHDSRSSANFLIPSPGENYAWMMFEQFLKVACVENLIIESFKQGVTYIKATLNYGVSFTVAPAVFGMVQTLLGRDSLGLRAFNLGKTTADFITQEDKCTDFETQHTTLEQAGLLVIGQTDTGTQICGATFTDSRPTRSPTRNPTLMTTASPSAIPTRSPTAITAIPTVHPSIAPSNDPTAVPTAVPSSVPSASPSAEPSAKPSVVPTSAKPSRRPTRAPTRFLNETWCTLVTLYDTFGDGWGPDIALQITHPQYDETTTLLEPLYLFYDCPEGAPRELCWQDEEVVIFDIVALNPPAKESWEIYWTVHWSGPPSSGPNATTEAMTFVGDYSTSMNVTMETFDVYDPVEYNNRTCHRCKHPPKPPAKPTPAQPAHAKPSHSGDTVSNSGSGDHSSHSSTASSSASSASSSEDDDAESVGTSGGGRGDGKKGAAQSKPKPHWPFPVTLFDTQGGGWFNASEAWTQIPLHSCGGGVSFPDGRALPETLTTPEFIISTIDRVHPLRRNQICGDLLREDCEERLPDGKYIFRVTGDLSKWDTQNETAWHFCGKHGTSLEELEFKLVHGKCFPGKKTTAADICCGEATVAFSGLLTLTFGDDTSAGIVDLTEFDTAVLESDIAEAFSTQLPSAHGFIALNSWASTDGGQTLVIPFSLAFNPATYDMSGMYWDEMEALQNTLVVSADAFIGSGQFLSYVQSSLVHLPLDTAAYPNLLGSMTGAAITDVVYLSTSIGGYSTVDAMREPGQESGSLTGPTAVEAAGGDTAAPNTLIYFEQSATVIFAALVAVVVFFTAFRNMRNKGCTGGGVDGESLQADSSRDLLGRETGTGLIDEIPPSV